MSAAVLSLPSACAAPVKQEGRSGRNPKIVVSLWRERRARSDNNRAASLRIKLDYVLTAKRENFEAFKRDTAALRVLEQRIAATSAVYSDLKARADALSAELAGIGASTRGA
jgi:septal ring factor EnvC (AmiA/AmiB activator)